MTEDSPRIPCSLSLYLFVPRLFMGLAHVSLRHPTQAYPLRLVWTVHHFDPSSSRLRHSCAGMCWFWYLISRFLLFEHIAPSLHNFHDFSIAGSSAAPFFSKTFSLMNSPRTILFSNVFIFRTIRERRIGAFCTSVISFAVRCWTPAEQFVTAVDVDAWPLLRQFWDNAVDVDAFWWFSAGGVLAEVATVGAVGVVVIGCDVGGITWTLFEWGGQDVFLWISFYVSLLLVGVRVEWGFARRGFYLPVTDLSLKG